MIAGLKKKQFAALSIVLVIFLCTVLSVSAYCQQEDEASRTVRSSGVSVYNPGFRQTSPRELKEPSRMDVQLSMAGENRAEIGREEVAAAVYVTEDPAEFIPEEPVSAEETAEIYQDYPEETFENTDAEAFYEDTYEEPQTFESEEYAEEPVYEDVPEYIEPAAEYFEEPAYEEPVMEEPVYEEVLPVEEYAEAVPEFYEEPALEPVQEYVEEQVQPEGNPEESTVTEQPASEPAAEESNLQEDAAEEQPAVEQTEETKDNLTYLGNFMLTAYCPCSLCCGSHASGKTASGTVATEGVTVAMAGLEFGTRIMIDGHIYTVEDRGTAYGHVDIFFASHASALSFGLKYADVYLVG